MFIQNAFNKNYWITAHIFFSGILTKFLFYLNIPFREIFIIIFILSIGWEIYEYNKNNVELIYGSKKRFYQDAFGDVFASLFICLICLI